MVTERMVPDPPWEDLPPLTSVPFGRGADGSPVRDVNGKLIAGTIRHAADLAGERASREAPPGTPAGEREARALRAREELLPTLVERLNALIPDPLHRVTAEMLLVEGNNYSHELELYVNELCRHLSGAEGFYFSRGIKIVPASVATIFRPFGLRQAYALVARATEKFVQSDVKVVETTARSAVIQWRADPQLGRIRPQLRRRWLQMSCAAYQGAYAAIPPLLHPGLAWAAVDDLRCQLKGDPCCEWRFTWENPKPRRAVRLLLGAAGSAALLAVSLSSLPGRELAAPFAALPLAAAWFGWRLAHLKHDRQQQDLLLEEQRATAEEQVDRVQAAYAELQQSSFTVRTKLAELTALHEVATAVSSSLDPDEVVDLSLKAVTRHLRYDRAAVFLVDDDRRSLARAHSCGLEPEHARVLDGVSIPLDDPKSLVAPAVRERRAFLVTGVAGRGADGLRHVAPALGVDQFLVAPLLAQGEALGVLLVDNGRSGRPLSEEGLPLLTTVGSTIAAAVENARLYRQIEAQNRTLEERVRERTQELAEATRVAEAANRAKSAFLAGMSHELRTPLNAILGYSEMLLEDDARAGGELQRADVERIQSSGRYLLGLVNDVLDLSKVEAGKMELVIEAFDLAPFLKGVVDTARPLVERNGNVLEIDGAEAPAVLRTDETKVRQVLLNLLGNAGKFTRKGRVSLRVAREEGPEGAPWVRFDVADTGIGMSAEQLERLFEPFAQAGAGTNRQFGGTGLGLALSRRLAGLLGGEVAVVSEPGSGSTFTLRLPVVATRPRGSAPASWERLKLLR